MARQLITRRDALRGTASVFGLVGSVSALATPMALENAGSINTALGLGGDNSALAATEETMRFPTAYTEDGLLSEEGQDALMEAEQTYNIRSMEEGAVLVMNENSALPLAAGSKITLLGAGSVKPVTHSYNEDRWVSLPDALAAAGFEVNQTVLDAYTASTTERDLENNAIGEESASFFTSSLTDSFASYADAAIVVLSRAAAEGRDAAFEDADGLRQMALHDEELELLSLASSSGFGHVVVVVNSGYAMELGELASCGVEACVVTSAPGDNGFTGLANLIAGTANFSGRLIDTYAANSLSAPAAMNFGDFAWANTDEIDDYGKGSANENYVVQAEGIYTGYKYYETRYEDCVTGQGNASSSAGCYASSGSWDYAAEVVYPFGHGLSYTSFEQVLDAVEVDVAAKTVTAVVTVTNAGSVAGKSVVELYSQSPYTAYDQQNGVEKAAIRLLDFEKTEELEPGASQQLTLESELYLVASYDAAGAAGYILDAGDYYFAIGDDAHDALNNVLAAKGYTTSDGMTAEGDAAKASLWTLDALDTESFATQPATDAEVTNRYDGALDLNDFIPGTVTHLTRSDWEGTYPVGYEGLSATAEMIPVLDGNTYETPADAPSVSDFTQGEDAGLSFVSMADIAYDDETWETFLDQLSVEDLAIAISDSYGIEAVESVGKPYHTNLDGIQHVNGNYPYGSTPACTVYVDEIVAASSWSKEILRQRGEFLGEDALYVGVPFLWSVGCNLHRTPYGGRNYEYFSECSTFTYHAANCVAEGMTSKGVLAGVKHFAANDQETNRSGVATFMTEQTLRENSLRGFEGAVTKAGTLGIMSSYNRIGIVAACQDSITQTQILRDEWGFLGVNVTDGSHNERYMHSYESAEAGTDMFCVGSTRGDDFVEGIEDGDGYLLQLLRQANKHYYYAMSRSLLTNGLTEEDSVSSSTPWWQTTLYAVTGIGLAGCAVLAAGSIWDSVRAAKGADAQ